MATSMDGFKTGLDNFMDLRLLVAIRHDSLMESPCLKVVCLWIPVVEGATVGEGF